MSVAHLSFVEVICPGCGVMWSVQMSGDDPVYDEDFLCSCGQIGEAA